MSYQTLITDAGLAALATAQAGGAAVPLAEMAFGDGNGAPVVPDPEQPALINEVHRRALNGLSVHPEHPEWIVIECVIPADVGGFTVREVGVIAEDGTLFAVSAYPEAYKPTPVESAGRDLYVKMILAVGNGAPVTLAIDPSVTFATVNYVQQALDDHEALPDPHPQYMTAVEVVVAIGAHEESPDPHPQYIDAPEFAAALAGRRGRTYFIGQI